MHAQVAPSLQLREDRVGNAADADLQRRLVRDESRHVTGDFNLRRSDLALEESG